MTKDEKRLCRREIISFTLQEIHFRHCMYVALNPHKKLTFIKEFTREYEVKLYKTDLRTYQKEG